MQGKAWQERVESLHLLVLIPMSKSLNFKRLDRFDEMNSPELYLALCLIPASLHLTDKDVFPFI